MNILKDSFGRRFPYIRLSISDVCNFKCGYCLPDGYKIDKSDNRTFITKEEIGRLAKALSELGVSKIRLTGGEPTVRKDFLDIIKIIKKNSGIKKTVITTNGYHLDRIADDLNKSGLDGINISIDSLDPKTFEDFKSWANFIKNNQIDFRYIELMQTGDNLDYFNQYHVSANKFTDYLNNNNWVIQTFGKDAGPSKNYINPEYKGKFGVIAPYSKDFCKSCNRLRITAKGDLRLCLFGNTGINIRHLMQRDNQTEELKDLILKQLNYKKESHYLEIGETGLTKNLSTTGG